jgi:catechol 2,3-dioxygenase-like lactoylglutathione lyase family enzyme
MNTKTHLSLNVRNVAASVDFYRRMFAVEPLKQRPGYAKFDVTEPPLNLALNEVPGVSRSEGLSHLGLQVQSTDDVLATRARWQDAGLATHDEMQTTCCYAKQDKTWVNDPDGNAWEVFVVLEDNVDQQATSCGCNTVSAESTQPAAACCAR